MDNSKDQYIHSFQFELFYLSEKSHDVIEDRFVKIFDRSLRRITQDYLGKYVDNEEIFIEALEIDLGELYQEDLERQLPAAFEKALEEQLKVYFKNAWHTLNKKKEKLTKSRLTPLFYYLKYGFFPWYYIHKESFPQLWKANLKKKSFIPEAYQHSWHNNEIERLSLLLIHAHWENTLNAFVPEQTEFIITYQQEVLQLHKEKRSLPALSKYQLNFLLKKFILTYIFGKRGSFFSKKQFLDIQLQQIAAHYNIKYKDLIELLVSHIKSIKKKSFLQQELHILLYRLNEDLLPPVSTTEDSQKPLRLRDIELYFKSKLSRSNPSKYFKEKSNLEKLQKGLFSFSLQKEIKKNWLAPIQEKKLYKLLQVSIGEVNTNHLRKFHQLLYKQRTLIHKKPFEPNFKKAVWEFTIDYFNYSFSFNFQLKNFIIYHTKAISNQYNLSYTQFLNSLVYCTETFLSSDTSSMELFYVIRQLSHTSLFEERPTRKDKLATLIENMIAITEKNGKITAEEIQKQTSSLAHEITHDKTRIELIYLLIEELKKVTKGGAQAKSLILKELYFLLEKSFLKTFPSLTFTEIMVILSSENQQELKELKNNRLTFYTFKKVLNNEQLLSLATVQDFKKVIQRKEIQTQFFGKWNFGLTSVEQENFIKIFAPQHHRFLIQVWQLFAAEFSYRNHVRFYEHFFKELVIKGFSEHPASFWKNQLPKMATRLNLSQVELTQRLMQKSLGNVQHTRKFNQHFACLSKLPEAPTNYYPSLEAIKNLNEIFPREKFFSKNKKDWRKLIVYLQKLTELPYHELWKKKSFSPFSGGDYIINTNIFPKQVIYLFRLLRQSYQLEQTWKKFNTFYNLNSFELFLFTISDHREIEKLSFQFSSISEQELKQWAHLLFTQNFYFDLWLERPTSYKAQFFETTLFEKTATLKEFYFGLAKIYAALPFNERPHTFKIFEAHFWNVLFYSLKNEETHAWVIIANWFSSLKLQHINHLIIKIEQANFHFIKQKEWKNWKSNQQQKVDIGTVHISKDEDIKETELPEGIWEMPNTGLVILHPFLRQLFTGLDYILPTGKFKSIIEMKKAVVILHYIATGKIITEEKEMAEEEFSFPKILCGFPVKEVIFPILLTEEEMSIAHNLLNACLNYGEKIKNSSINSLRYTFLQRKGHIELVENAYQLTVEKSGTDILLDSLPWSFSTIKLPWLNKIIYISWR